MKDLVYISIVFFLVMFFSSVYQAEHFTELQLVKTLPNISAQSIAVGEDVFYAIQPTHITQYSLTTGAVLHEVDLIGHTRIKSLQGGVVVRNRLYVTNHNPETLGSKQNTIEVFDATLKYIYHINVTGNTGKLTWVDYYDDKWWGGFAHDDAMVANTVMVEFYHPRPDLSSTPEDKDLVQWHIRNRWFLPAIVYENMRPYSNYGGSFGPDGKMYMTGNKSNKVYVLDFYRSTPMLSLDHVKETELNGNGLTWHRGKKILMVTNSDSGKVLVYGM